MIVSDNDHISDDINKRRQQCEELVRVNCCNSDKMSRCNAGLIWQEQKKCQHAIKSTLNNKCMHFIESANGQCDCVDAKKD